ncbi:hypothetical protein E4U41_006020 [Claviceps citrina]|nr:hypothetical protein E4U41_006020 [Claviceps citrina]
MAIESLMGSVVAFEGEPDLVSTQLRLLPTSSQLLILPSIESYIKPDGIDQRFSARGFVRQIHAAMVARNDAARAFLDGSTTDHKRLVFLNGSTPGAQTLCVKEIMKHETNGDRAMAEGIFEDIVKNGVAGLEDDSSNMDLGNHRFGCSHTVKDHVSVEEDPITKAMRAADALDRQTASLQPCNDIILSPATRPRSSSLPLYGYVDEFADSTPFYVFGVRPNGDEKSPAGGVTERVSAPPTPSATMFTNSARHTSESPTLGPLCSSTSIHPASCVGETYHSVGHACCADDLTDSPVSEAFSLQSSDQVVFGEASVVDVRLSFRCNSLSRVKSLDGIHPASPRARYHDIPTRSWLDEPDPPSALQHPTSVTGLCDDRSRSLSRVSIIELPRTTVVKPRPPPVKMQPIPTGRKKKKAKESIDMTRPRYIDRGTDARQSVVKEVSYQPVLHPIEDLVVNLIRHESSDVLLESAVSAFKYRLYPPFSYSPTASDADNNDGSTPGTPAQPSSESREDGLRVRVKRSETMSPTADDYDPFAYTQPSGPPSKSPKLAASLSTVHPPTAAQPTPPPAMGEIEGKIHEFHVGLGQSAVSVQNSLRSILSDYFPPVTQTYRRFQTSLLPEFGELWKPLFRGSSSQRDDGNSTQILAIGSQKGVKQEYSHAVTGRLEKVGRKSCEIVRTGRVDFRYLLANAMQAFTAQRLANQTDNPFTNSYLLATLIIPHLETYLTLHTDVRYLLLMYPPDHLAAVLALQKLIGIDVMKVAQIVDPTSKDDSPFTHIRGASINKKFESKPSRSAFSPRTSSHVAVSKANYLLTSTASEQDIATFVSTVWNIGIEGTEVPVPDTASKEAQRKGSPSLKNDGRTGAEYAQTTPRRSASSKSTTHAPSPQSLAATAAPTSHEPPSTAVSLRAPAFAETVKTSKSTKTKRSPPKLRPQSAPQADTDSLAGLEYIDDSDDDLDERRLMPVCMQKHSLRKPNSRKALKFLGLA